MRHLATQTREDIRDLRISDVMADQTIELAATQRDRGARWQVRFAGHIDNRTGFTAADVQQQTRRALHRLELQLRVDAALVAVRGIGMQAVTTRATGDGERREERAFQQHIAGFTVHTGVFAAENTAHRERFFMVRDDQRIGVQRRLIAVEQRQRLALFRHAHHDAAIDAVKVEGVHRLTQLKQDVVGDVNHGVDRADTAAAQFFTHPQRGRRGHVDAFHNAAQVARAGISGVNLNRQRVVDGRRDRRDGRRVQGLRVQHRDIARHADNAEAVGTVRGNANFDGVIVKLQIIADVSADGRVCRQFDNAVMVVGNAKLGERAQHAFRRLAAQFRRFDFKIARQYCANGRHSHFEALAAVRRAADDVEQAIAADVHFGDAQFVGVRMLAALHHFAHDHAVKRACDRLNAVNFQARHGDLIRQRIAVKGRVYPLA
ncbi:conserved hypothetical protein [Cronobacter dublinensis 582]|nr:conserved hypothetical protein [Cronobacter dublinensis 582]